MARELRRIPSVDRLIRALQQRLAQVPDVYLAEAARAELAACRRRLCEGGTLPEFDELCERAADRVQRLSEVRPRRVLNLTGVPIHTNLGRAPLSARASVAVRQAAEGYTDLEYDLYTGGRGSRLAHVEGLLTALTGAEAALVVNNNAAAVLLTLAALTRRGQQVVIARGQLVEIGGSFRIPDVLVQGGARLREIGATNKVHRRDYEQAIDAETGAIIWVHPSNFRMIGFTEDVALKDLSDLAHAHHLPLIADLGSGTLVDLRAYGLPYEPTVRDVVASGADVVTFSGDKLLGGPQAGIVVGQAQAITRLKQHPFYRALRSDKLTLAGLSETLRAYYEGTAAAEIPVLRMLSASADDVARRARSLVRILARHGVVATTAKGHSVSGGGALPGEQIPTTLVLLPDEGSAELLMQNLRQANPPVIGRVLQDRVALDLRTLLPGEEKQLVAAICEVYTKGGGERWLQNQDD